MQTSVTINQIPSTKNNDKQIITSKKSSTTPLLDKIEIDSEETM
jgi:hypothetical protein